MLESFDIMFIRRDQKQRKNGETCRASPTRFWSSLINFILKTHDFLFIVHHRQIFLNVRTSNKGKSNAVLLDLVDVANALRCMSVMSLNQSDAVITANINM